jgi:hypothetical protein
MISWYKNLSLSNKITCWVALILFITALGFATYAIITRPGDVGLMVRDGHELKWHKSDFPLECMYDAEELSPEYLTAIESVMAEFNTQVGFSLFGHCLSWVVPGGMPEHAESTVIIDLCEDRKAHGATTKHRYDKKTGQILSASVCIDPGLSGLTLYKAVLHEMGHVIGLDHDREKTSIMYPSIGARPKELSKKDVSLLRGVYDA